jgi:Leucine-rich repeat (LRR) protein
LTITDFVEFAENYPPSISTLEMNNVGKTSIAKITALPNLTNLDLNNVTFLEDYAKFTGQLDTLIIDGCNLKTIEIVDGTCLKKLVIRNCPKLTALIGNFDWELINAAD